MQPEHDRAGPRSGERVSAVRQDQYRHICRNNPADPRDAGQQICKMTATGPMDKLSVHVGEDITARNPERRRNNPPVNSGSSSAPERIRTSDLLFRSWLFAGRFPRIAGVCVWFGRVLRGCFCRVRDTVRDTDFGFTRWPPSLRHGLAPLRYRARRGRPRPREHSTCFWRRQPALD